MQPLGWLKLCVETKRCKLSNVLRPNDEFTESSVETMNCLLDTLAPGSREVNYSKAAEEPNDNTAVLPTHDEIVSSICSLEKMERAINEFLPFTTPRPDGIDLVLLQKSWNSIRNIYQTRKGLVSSSLNPVKKTIMKLSLSG